MWAIRGGGILPIGIEHFDRGLRDCKFWAIERGLIISIEPLCVQQEGPAKWNIGIEDFDRNWKCQSRLKMSARIENLDLNWEFQDRIENYNPDLGSQFPIRGYKIPPLPRKSWKTTQKLQIGPPRACPENYSK